MKEFMKPALTATFTCIIAMLGFWLVEGSEYTTRGEVRSMIVNESPYVQDRKFILSSITSTNDLSKEVVSAIQKLEVQIAILNEYLKTVNN